MHRTLEIVLTETMSMELLDLLFVHCIGLGLGVCAKMLIGVWGLHRHRHRSNVLCSYDLWMEVKLQGAVVLLQLLLVNSRFRMRRRESGFRSDSTSACQQRVNVPKIVHCMHITVVLVGSAIKSTQLYCLFSVRKFEWMHFCANVTEWINRRVNVRAINGHPVGNVAGCKMRSLFLFSISLPLWLSANVPANNICSQPAKRNAAIARSNTFPAHGQTTVAHKRTFVRVIYGCGIVP